MVGANRILRGVAIAIPRAIPMLGPRRGGAPPDLVERALEHAREREVEPLTVWETTA